MPEKIGWTLNVQVVGGPSIVEAQNLEVPGYDKIEVEIADQASDEDVEIQPGDAGQVQFLLIRSDAYHQPAQGNQAAKELSYSVNAAEANADKRIKLDAPQFFVGSGAVALLGQAPKKLFFYNKLGKKAAITILVGRKVTT